MLQPKQCSVNSQTFSRHRVWQSAPQSALATAASHGRLVAIMPANAKNLVSHRIIRALTPKDALGQLGGHIKRGCAHPVNPRTGKTMALVSALPLSADSDKMVLSFMDRSDSSETFDAHPAKGDNAVLIVPRAEVHTSSLNGVCAGDWKGLKVAFGEAMEEPMDLDIDPTGLDLKESDRWVDLVDEIGCDCTKLGGYPLWTNAPIEVEELTGKKLRFHHRIAGDLVDLKLGDGGVVYVFVEIDGNGGALCWQQAL